MKVKFQKLSVRITLRTCKVALREKLFFPYTASASVVYSSRINLDHLSSAYVDQSRTQAPVAHWVRVMERDAAGREARPYARLADAIQ